MSNDAVKNEMVKIVEALTKLDVPNEVKKRTAVATMNRFLNDNKNITLSDKEIDDLVEEVVSNVSK